MAHTRSTTAPSTYLVTDDHTPVMARFPAIDAHNHLWGRGSVDAVIEVLDTVGIALYCDLTANASIEFADGGYALHTREFDNFLADVAAANDRIYGFTLAGFAAPTDGPLFYDASTFTESCCETLVSHVKRGAMGLKVLKEMGLSYKDSNGKLIRVDDERLSPIWETAGRLGVPVLIHQSDPYGFFEPITPENEHYESLLKYPSWSFSDDKTPSKLELLARRDNLIRQHPGTTFILPHVANYAEHLGYVSELIEENENVYVDFSARLDEIGRTPYATRELCMTHQDRILFGTDMPADIESSIDMYRTYFRFFETYDEGFFAPDYDGTFTRARWTICGIGLPDDVLQKIYFANALTIMPALRRRYERTLKKGAAE